jgi:N-acetylmuramoyl-L-alanine amidase
VIVECGFLSNAQECARLQDEEYQQKIAFVILQSLVEENKMNEG